ncbi:hypothetical protein [Streptomyces olivaceoviridis]
MPFILSVQFGLRPPRIKVGRCSGDIGCIRNLVRVILQDAIGEGQWSVDPRRERVRVS